MATIRYIKRHNNWELDLGTDLAGKKVRRYFKTEDDAKDELKKHEKEEKSHGGVWARLSKLERAAVAAVLQQMAARGLTLTRVANLSFCKSESHCGHPSYNRF